jgi:hypothetical protein
MLTGIHFLLTYMCNLRCDHCFLYSGPDAKGTFTLEQVRQVLDEATKIGTITSIFFEGGEPFLFYPLMLEGIKIARSMNFKTGIVTNAYYAISEKDVELWLNPLCKLGIANLSISDDSFHFEEKEDNPAKRLLSAAKRLDIPANSICIEQPSVETSKDKGDDKGAPVISGGAKLRGRAVEKLVEGLPKRNWEELKECPYEDLKDPKRVHVDSYGNVHLCQGLSMGNMWRIPLSTMVRDYDPASHPVCRPLIKGGPALLAKEYSVRHDVAYVDECHFCYLIRLSLLDKFPQYLAPRQVYGLD